MERGSPHRGGAGQRRAFRRAGRTAGWRKGRAQGRARDDDNRRRQMTSLSIEGGRLAIPAPDQNGVRAYKGIPYAAPPVGRLRWRPPEPVPPWQGERSANAFGPNSLQGVVFGDIDPSVCGVSEDCLYLNVWTPAESGSSQRLPVMVWIHGGGFVVGSGSEPRYDGFRLASRGIVVVTLNHRLNALGFLAHRN